MSKTNADSREDDKPPVILLLCGLVPSSLLGASIRGTVLDLNENQVAYAMITLNSIWPVPISIRSVDHELVRTDISADTNEVALSIIIRFTRN